MRRSEYVQQLRKHVTAYAENGMFGETLKENQREICILAELNFDPVIPILASLYSPKEHGKKPRDPVCMLRSLILMTVKREKSITRWVGTTRCYGYFYGKLAGFDAESEGTPGVGTYYDFMKRIIDGPYSPPHPEKKRKSDEFGRSYERSLPDERQAKKDDRDPNQPKSAKLVKELLSRAEIPRADNFNKIIEDFLFSLGVMPSVEAGLITGTDSLIITGDGSIMKTGASKFGQPSCQCRDRGIYDCGHARLYSSPTAEFCYDHHNDCFVFGDRYYHLILTQNGHDYPVHAHMPGGNESDYTLSLTSADRTLKMIPENGADMEISVFCGDGHHDSHAHYEYFDEKGILTVIPLSGKSKGVVSRLPDNKDVRLNEKAVPLCPEGLPMRHHGYNTKRKTHVYSCPVKRQTRRDGKAVYVTRTDECPRKQDCMPESSLGPFVYIKSETDPRLFPQIPRGSRKYRKIYNLRSGSERGNAYIDSYNIEGAHRNVFYSLIRLILSYIVIHADIRYREFMENAPPEQTTVTGFLNLLSPEFQYRSLPESRAGP